MRTLLFIFVSLSLLRGEEATKLQVGKPTIVAPVIAIPELDALKLGNAQKDLTISQYQINEYWKVINQLQEKVKKDGEVIQHLTSKVFEDAKVSAKEYRISEDGLKLERITSPVAQAKEGK